MARIDDGQDVVAFANTVVKGIHNPKIIKIINDLTKVMDNLTLAMSKGNFIGNNESVREIEDMHREILQIGEDVRGDFDFGIQKADIDVKPIERSDKSKLSPVILSLLDTKDYKRAEAQLARAVNGYYMAYNTAIQTRLFGAFSKDARNAEAASMAAKEIYHKLSNFMDTGFRTAHACVKYIKASTQK